MRIRELRSAFDLSQADLARAVGVSPAAVAQWELGKTRPSFKSFHRMEELYGWAVKWLETGCGPREVTKRTALSTGQSSGMVPIGTKVPVIAFPTIPDVLIGKTVDPATMAVDWTFPPMKDHGPRTFAFKMPDNSMACATDETIPQGHYVWVDPDQTSARHEQAVLAKLETGQHLVAQYMDQAGRQWLAFLNPGYDGVKVPFEIVGRVIFSGRER